MGTKNTENSTNEDLTRQHLIRAVEMMVKQIPDNAILEIFPKDVDAKRILKNLIRLMTNKYTKENHPLSEGSEYKNFIAFLQTDPDILIEIDMPDLELIPMEGCRPQAMANRSQDSSQSEKETLDLSKVISAPAASKVHRRRNAVILSLDT